MIMNTISQTLGKLCTASGAELRKMGEFHRTDEDDGAGFTMVRRGGRVLGIAHTDVSSEVEDYRVDLKESDATFGHPWLDDRLGVHALLYMLPDLGVTFDVMLTEKEEISDSTGGRPQAIAVASEYNWMLMMDRRGNDCAMYGYDMDNGDWKEVLERSGWMLSPGSSSCIKYMEEAGVKGANFGVGYKKEHSEQCYAEKKCYIQQCTRVAEFVKEFGARRFIHKNTGAPIKATDLQG